MTTKSFLKAFAMTFVVAICPMLTNVGAAEALQSKSVRVVVFSSCSVCRLDNSMTISAGVENVSDDPISIYGELGWGELAGFTLHVINSKGIELQRKSLDDGLIVPSTLDNPSYYVTLFKWHALSFLLKIDMRNLFNAPGKYTVWVSYRSPVPLKSSAVKDNFLSFEEGSFSSNKIVIEVVH